ncbi:zinc knuckle CX2CX4HX4C containing protein, partial [Tanacetum coccineum]
EIDIIQLGIAHQAELKLLVRSSSVSEPPHKVNVEYERKPPGCSSCKVFGHVLNECPKKIVSNVVKKLNNPRQATGGVSVGPKVSFKSTKQIYRPVSNKNGESTSDKKKQVEVSRQEVGNLNPFDALNSIENDDDLGTNGGNLKLAGKGSLNVTHGNVVSDSEVEVVFDETANLMALMRFKCGGDRGYGTDSMLEQWRKINRDDDYDPYHDDLYESYDMSDHLQVICDDLDITVRGRKKK